MNSERWERPIGVFDSGIGGISVLRELRALMPNENFIFYGDSRHAPYGTKSLEEVRRLSCADAAYLKALGIKALVVACNTATSAAIRILREKYADMPVIGIEPALKPAVQLSEYPRVLVLATPMTLREEKFQALMQAHRKEADIIPLPCPGLVEYVERGETEGPALERFLVELFAEYMEHPVDCVVLGCTHYPFVRGAIQKVLGAHVKILDGGKGTARETKRQLRERALLNLSQEKGRVVLLNSLESENLRMLGYRLLNAKKEEKI
ncbi:MAG: glutamate racemase [Roseburia sp.]